MTWKEVSPMEERIRFAVLAEREEKSMSELYKEFRISRKTGYKWLKRYRMLGVAGMRELSRRPIHCPHKTQLAVEKLILSIRRKHRGQSPDPGISVFSSFFLSRFSSFSRLCSTLFTALDIFPISPICSCSLNHLFPTVVYFLIHQPRTCFIFSNSGSSFSSCFSKSKTLRPILIHSRIRGPTPFTFTLFELTLLFNPVILYFED